jgi:calcineurin-like phosphoesterase family protein
MSDRGLEKSVDFLVCHDNFTRRFNVKRIWLITDEHYGKKIPEIAKTSVRKDGYDRIIRNSMRSLISKDDTVLHLGDFGELSFPLDLLLGTHILVKGNHDKLSRKKYMDMGFVLVCNQLTIGNVLLSHKPIVISDPNVRYNIHGHFHDFPKDRWEPELIAVLEKRHRLLALEYTGFQPVLFDACLVKPRILRKTVEQL